MGGHGSHPLGWTVLALVIVAYAHVILELAAATVALAIAMRILPASPWRVPVDRMTCRQKRQVLRGRDRIGTLGSMSEASASRREVDRHRPTNHDN